MSNESSSDAVRDRMNLDPHKGAVAAMWLWGAAYAAQRGGSIDFWDSLTEDQRRLCVRLVQDIECARPMPPAPNAELRRAADEL